MDFALTDRNRAGVGTAAVLALGLGIAVDVLAVLGSAVVIRSLSGSSSTPIVVVMAALLRTLTSLAVVFLGVGLAARRLREDRLGYWLGVALIGYLLDVFAWGGNALLVATMVGGADDPSLPARVIGFVLDLVVWLAVAALAVRLSGRGGARRAGRGDVWLRRD